MKYFLLHLVFRESGRLRFIDSPIEKSRYSSGLGLSTASEPFSSLFIPLL